VVYIVDFFLRNAFDIILCETFNDVLKCSKCFKTIFSNARPRVLSLKFTRTQCLPPHTTPLYRPWPIYYIISYSAGCTYRFPAGWCVKWGQRGYYWSMIHSIVVRSRTLYNIIINSITRLINYNSHSASHITLYNSSSCLYEKLSSQKPKTII